MLEDQIFQKWKKDQIPVDVESVSVVEEKHAVVA